MWVRGCKANGSVHIVNYTIFYNDSLIISYVLIAQLDRVFGYEPKGQGFESLAARQVKATPWVLLLFLCLRGGSNPERVSGVKNSPVGCF